jgi:intein-encoded DNA endonuclease-like protein
MARTSGYPIANRALDGELEALLLRWDADDVSLFDMAYKLRSEHDLSVSPSTIGRWLKSLKASA